MKLLNLLPFYLACATLNAQEPSDFARLVKRADGLRPRPEETRWMQIPWVRSAIEGERLARTERRPIMYWHVDDDPLERC